MCVSTTLGWATLLGYTLCWQRKDHDQRFLQELCTTPDLSAFPQTTARLSTSVSEKPEWETRNVFRFNPTMIREAPEWGRGKWWEELWKWDDKNTGRGCKRGERKCFALTFFCVARCILARVAHQAIEVPGSSFQHVIPRQQKKYKHLFLSHVSSSALLKVLKVVLKLLEMIRHELNQFLNVLACRSSWKFSLGQN